jgi:UDP-N-acetylglucosamine--N-acetylmuramyl-(pentapeptide) pyrophosphoryl-undecaprenol N-acetylglucosamine transferase
MPHLVVMAAGTGGHVIPGLAVAQRDAAPRLDRELARHPHRHGKPPRAATGIPLDAIAFSGLRGKGLLHTLTGGCACSSAFWDCLGILRRRGADAVLGMGGYVCFPAA